jgi:putative aldouronate transport system permease protein
VRRGTNVARPIISKRSTLARVAKSWQLYLLLLPALVCIILFAYAPMYGVQIAFRDFKVNLGFFNSPWAGFKYFNQFIGLSNFWNLLKNTLLISVYSLLFGFPAPIILALLLNQLKMKKFKSFIQTVTYAPYFISIVVIVSMLNIFLQPSTGFVNNIAVSFGNKPVAFMGRPEWFRSIYVISGIWQGVGWGAIVYLASLGGVNPELYEAAMVDGASRLKRLWHIDIPSILPTVVIMFILQMGNLMNVGYEKAFLMQNSQNNQISEIISTYVYKVGLLNGKYSFATAVGLFNSVINCALVLSVNAVSKKLTETSLW